MSSASAGASSRGSPDSVRGSHGRGLTRASRRSGERIGRLKEQSRGVAQHYTIEVLTDESGRKATALTWKRQPRQGSMVTHPGVYCLRSNQTDWDEESLWRTYTTLTDVEAVFRSLKSELGLRPIYHHKPVRSEGHLFPDRHRLSTGAGHPQTPQAAGRLLQLDHAAAHPGRTAAGHGDLPAWGRADLARTQGHAGRNRSQGHLRRLGHRSRSRRGPQDDRLIPPHIAGFNAFVVPLARFCLRNLLIISVYSEAVLKMG